MISSTNTYRALILFVAALILSACQPQGFGKVKPALGQIKSVPASIFSAIGVDKRSVGLDDGSTAEALQDVPLQLKDILGGSLTTTNPGTDFLGSVKYALDTDPEVIAKRREVEAKRALVAVVKSQKDFQVNAKLLGGIEDVTDNTKGLAFGIDASRLVYDGGKVDSEIASYVFKAEAARMDLAATINQRADILFQNWLELEKYKSLQEQIDKRLSVLDPLINQLEKVAEAGIGDLSKVTAAQRTVSAIRVQQTDIAEGLAQAQLEFLNAFGVLNNGIDFDYDFIDKLVPDEIDDSLVQNSPILKSQYASYQSSLALVKALRAKDGFDVGFEAKAMRPFAGSEYDSDESIGLVGRKTLLNGDMLESEIREAEAISAAKLELIRATYRTGARSVAAAFQNIESMEKAILLARESAKLTSEEIIYLRQQLIIGGSTLDSVLSAEAMLYEAESKEIKFLTEKYKSQVIIASSLGLLSGAIGF